MEQFEIQLIRDLQAFKKIRNDWEEIYKKDVNANLYLSWLWLFCCFSFTKEKWLVIGLKNNADDSFVAFIALSERNRRFANIIFRNYFYPGNPISAYSGFLCKNDFEKKALPTFENYLTKTMKWDSIHLQWFRDVRAHNFISMFPNSKFIVKIQKGLDSLRIKLTGDYNEYLSELVRKKTRDKIRRETRQIINNKRFKILTSSPETIDRDINQLCKLWNDKWHKSSIMNRHRNILHEFYKNDILKLTMIWDGEIPVAGLACIIDHNKNTYNAYITGYNPEYSKLSPGTVIFAECIKKAIEEKYKFFDFTVGLDPYKLSFGSEKIETYNITITRKNFKTSIKTALKKQIKSIVKLLQRNNKTT